MTPETWSWLAVGLGLLLAVCGVTLAVWAFDRIQRGRGQRRVLHWCTLVAGIGVFVAGEKLLVAGWTPVRVLAERIPDVLVSPGFVAGVTVMMAGSG